MKYLKTILPLAVFSVLFMFCASAHAEETIRNFQSEITVAADASMTVKETITVRCEQDQIKRGIYRDFPTRYKDRHGKRYTVGFTVIEVLKNGSPEPYHITDEENGKRVYIGDKNLFLDTGDYTYTIVYKTDRQIGYFKDHDELYWNVTVNGWDFPVERASAFVRLPEEAMKNIMETDAYTGLQGLKEKDFKISRDASGAVLFTTTRSFERREGLTIVVTWPKGYVWEPSQKEKMAYLVSDNKGIIIGFFSLLLIVLYYWVVWIKVGKDPEPGTVMTRYTPPEKMTPAVMRYIKQMGYDDKVLASAVIDMAVKGHVKIKDDNGKYIIEKQDRGTSPLSTDEERVLNKLLGSDKTITLESANHARIRSAIDGLKNYLSLTYEKIYFVTNQRYFIAGLLVTICLLILSGFRDAADKGRLPIFLFMCVWLSGWTAGVSVLLSQVYRQWRKIIRSRRAGIVETGSSLFLTFFSVPFVIGEVVGIGAMTYATSVAMLLFLLIGVAVNVLFYHLLKAPTLAGRKVLDAIDGFAVFISATEKDRLEMLNPPEKTPELFEKYLPYALALDLEQAWSEQFSDVLSSAAAEEGRGGYSPIWYAGTSLSAITAGDFTSSLSSSFSEAISSSSTAPGSSSGSGGGGSSGGGGGGGGGGGW